MSGTITLQGLGSCIYLQADVAWMNILFCLNFPFLHIPFSPVKNSSENYNKKKLRFFFPLNPIAGSVLFPFTKGRREDKFAGTG